MELFRGAGSRRVKACSGHHTARLHYAPHPTQVGEGSPELGGSQRELGGGLPAGAGPLGNPLFENDTKRANLIVNAPEKFATHLKMNSFAWKTTANIYWEITTDIALATPEDPVRMRDGHVEVWPRGTVGRRSIRRRRGKLKGSDSRKRRVVRKSRLLPKVGHRALACPKKHGGLDHGMGEERVSGRRGRQRHGGD